MLRLPTSFQWDYCIVEDNKKEIQGKDNIDSPENVEVESLIKAFLKIKEPSNLVVTKSKKPRASQTKWHRDCDLDKEGTDWKINISANKNIHKSTKRIIFQFKFLHRRLPTNSFLYKIAVTNSDLLHLLQGRNRNLAPLFLAMQSDLSFLGKFFPMATIMLFNPERKLSCH